MCSKGTGLAQDLAASSWRAAWASCGAVLSCRPLPAGSAGWASPASRPVTQHPPPAQQDFCPLPVSAASYLDPGKVSCSTCPDARSWGPPGPGSAPGRHGPSGPALGSPAHLCADRSGVHLPLHAVLHLTGEYLLPRQPGHQLVLTVFTIHAMPGPGVGPLSLGAPSTLELSKSRVEATVPLDPLSACLGLRL